MKVSVLMITYNHEKYIAQALDSVLAQVVDFEYEIVIGEDCSTDSTRSIVLQYKEKHPDLIKTLLPDENVGMMPNFLSCIRACTGKYIALLEGDDFWSSEHKLQKQADFLDRHPECSICFNPTRVFYEHDQTPSYVSPSPVRARYTIEDLLHDNFMQTCSVMCRNQLESLPEWFGRSLVGDYPFHLLNAGYGAIGCIDEVMSAYRVHSHGVWSMQHQKHLVRNVKARLDLYKNIDGHYDRKYHALIADRMFQMELTLYKNAPKRPLWKSKAMLLSLITRYPLQSLAQMLGKLRQSPEGL